MLDYAIARGEGGLYLRLSPGAVRKAETSLRSAKVNRVGLARVFKQRLVFCKPGSAGDADVRCPRQCSVQPMPLAAVL
jgi:hypothetical protein